MIRDLLHIFVDAFRLALERALIILRILGAIVLTFVMWVGSAQLSVAILGPGNTLSIGCAMLGMVFGMLLSQMIFFPRTIWPR